MSKSTTARTATAADVRAFFNDPKAGPARVARFGLADDKSIRKGARGRLSPGAIKGYNTGKVAGRRYVTGNTGEVAAAAKAAALDLRVKAFEADQSVGQRGPLSNAAKAAVGVKVTKRSASRAKA